MMHLVNSRTSESVASSVEIADTRKAKRRGLLGRASLASGSAMLLPSCCAVHTVGMRFAIDVAFLDAGGRIRKIVRNLPPWRIAMAPGAAMTIELAAGGLDAQAVRVGDELRVVPAPQGAN